MKGRLHSLLAVPVVAALVQIGPGPLAPAAAQPVTECDSSHRMTEIDFPLRQVTRAIAAKRLNILVLGAGSSQLPGPAGAKGSYPARLREALAAKLPGVEVQVATDIKATRTAAEMVKTLGPSLAAAKPALMIWQTATVDAMQSVDTDQFSQALTKGIKIARAAQSDVVFINPQYSPRTESMIALSSYVEVMRWVALQHEIPLFDRFNLMKTWSDLGTFDLYSATKKLDMAERVHDCLGRLLADLVLEASKTTDPSSHAGQEPAKAPEQQPGK